MKKKNAIGIIALCVALCALLGLTVFFIVRNIRKNDLIPAPQGNGGVIIAPPANGLGSVEPPHQHVFGEISLLPQHLASEATCTAAARYYLLCACGEVGSETRSYGFPSAHVPVNGICKFCGRAESTGLLFSQVDETSCSVVGYGSCTDTDLVIPTTSPSGLTVTQIASYAFKQNAVIERITIPASVKSIGESAFESASLHSVYFSEDGALKTIDERAFYGCPKLDAVILPEGLITLGSDAFWGCSMLRSVTLPTTLKTIEKYTFAECPRLLSLTLPEGITTLRECAFGFCSALASVTLPSTLEVIDEEAFGYAGITEIHFPAALRELHANAFYACASLETVTIDPANSVYEVIDGALYRKSDHQLILYPLAKKSSTLTLPDGVTVIHANTFDQNQALQSVVIPATVTKIESNAFFGCSQLKTVTFAAGSALTEIGEGAFSHCTSLESIVIPDGVTEIKSGAFADCHALESVSLPYGLTAIRMWAFDGCVSLAAISLPSTLRIIEAAAFQETALTEIHIPRNVIECDSAFPYCTFLSAIQVENGNHTFRSVDGVLYSGDGKQLILYPAAKTTTEFTVPDGVEHISSFEGNKYVETVHIPASVELLGNFSNCTNLKSITFAENSAIQSLYGFSGCTALTEIVLPDHLTVISSNAFDGCTSLRRIVMPASVEQIDLEAFMTCTALVEIEFKGTVAQWNEIEFGDDFDLGTPEYVVHCSDGDVAKP